MLFFVSFKNKIPNYMAKYKKAEFIYFWRTTETVKRKSVYFLFL